MTVDEAFRILNAEANEQGMESRMFAAVEHLKVNFNDLRKINSNLNNKLRNIETLLADHPEVSTGNSKVHLAYHTAKR